MTEATTHKRIEIFDMKCKCKCGAVKKDIATKPKASMAGNRHKKMGPAAASSTDALHPDVSPSPEEVLSVLGAYLAEPEVGNYGDASATAVGLRASTRQSLDKL